MFPAFVAAVEVSHETHDDGGENDRERFKHRVIHSGLSGRPTPQPLAGDCGPPRQSTK